MLDNNTNIICYDTSVLFKIKLGIKFKERGSFVGYLTISCWNLIAKVVKQMKLLIKSLRCASQGLRDASSHRISALHNAVQSYKTHFNIDNKKVYKTQNEYDQLLNNSK